jgi:hypothetical protein
MRRAVIGFDLHAVIASAETCQTYDAEKEPSLLMRAQLVEFAL